MIYKRPDVRTIGKWVVVSHDDNVYHFDTFNEALHSPIKGHVMTEQFYKQCYEKRPPYVDAT